ncbi:hypothetical protein ABWH74_001078 [Burkholderia vietnamiensis]
MQPKSIANDLVDRINEMQNGGSHFVDTSRLDAQSRAWRLLMREVEKLFAVDAQSAWELTGMLEGLRGDRDATEAAFEKSLALGISTSNRLNHMVNRLNLGLFSLAQRVYSEVGAPEGGNFCQMVENGFKAGAVFRAHQFATRAQAMNLKWNDRDSLGRDLDEAVAILYSSGIDDEQIGRRLDLAGDILHRHRLKSRIRHSVINHPGDFVGVTYRLHVPATPSETFNMNVELAEAETAAGIVSDSTFEVVFEAISE